MSPYSFSVSVLCLIFFFFFSKVYNQVQGDYGLEMRAEALSQLIPFIMCPRPRVQHAALWSLERMAEDQSPGKQCNANLLLFFLLKQRLAKGAVLYLIGRC